MITKTITNKEILQWIKDGGLDDTIDPIVVELAAASPYANDPITGYSLNDNSMHTWDQLHTLNKTMVEISKTLTKIADKL